MISRSSVSPRRLPYAVATAEVKRNLPNGPQCSPASHQQTAREEAHHCRINVDAVHALEVELDRHQQPVTAKINIYPVP